MAVALVATASCSNELDDTLLPANNGNLQFVVSDFPAFGEGAQTRAIGTPDEGKTEWETNDKITVTFTSAKYGEQTATLTYDGSSWTSSGPLSYLENETPTVSAVYNPCADTPGLGEYLVTTDYTIADNTLNISFANAERTYSRLRIAGLANQTLTVTTTDFTPAGPEGATAPESYTLTTDDKGNAYLYGTFMAGATVTAKSEYNATLADYTFTAETYPSGTESGKSYALDARPITIDGTLGGKTEATKEDIEELANFIKTAVEEGKTSFIVTGENQAIYVDKLARRYPVAGYAFAELYSYTYNGLLDVTYRDATEILEEELAAITSVKTFVLPKVTICGDDAFAESSYLEKIVFGSVVTSVGADAFYSMSDEVDGGCELVLNKDQVNVEGLAPDLTNNTWAGYTWKSITLK